MFSQTSPKVVAPLAQALTESNRLLALRSEHIPLAASCECYSFNDKPNKVAYSHQLATVSQEDFEEENAVVSTPQEEAFDHQADLMAQGLKALTFKARQVIIPTINAYVEAYQARRSVGSQPNLNVLIWQYAPVHSEPALINHVQMRYEKVRAQDNYRTFMMGPKTAEAIIELAATNNPHLDQQQVTEWLLKVGADRIVAVWNQLFNKARSITPSSLDFVAPHRLPQAIDELLLAYCLCGHFIDNPVDGLNESVSLEEWKRSMTLLHEYLGSRLLYAYQRRVDDSKFDVLIYRSQAVDPLLNMSVSVEVNGDIYQAWLDKGGQVETILGGAVYKPGLRKGAQLLEDQPTLVKRWNQLYPLMRQACVDRVTTRRRQEALATLMDDSVVKPEGLPQLAMIDARTRAQSLVRGLKEQDFDNPFQMFAKLVCGLHYDNPIYLDFLHAFEHYAKLHPEATPRELAVYSLIEVAASWMAAQVQVIDFKPQVDPNATLEPAVSQEVNEADAEVAAQQALINGGGGELVTDAMVDATNHPAPVVTDTDSIPQDGTAVAVDATDVEATVNESEVDAVKGLEGSINDKEVTDVNIDIVPEEQQIEGVHYRMEEEYLPTDEHGEMPPSKVMRRVPITA